MNLRAFSVIKRLNVIYLLLILPLDIILSPPANKESKSTCSIPKADELKRKRDRGNIPIYWWRYTTVVNYHSFLASAPGHWGKYLGQQCDRKEMSEGINKSTSMYCCSSCAGGAFFGWAGIGRGTFLGGAHMGCAFYRHMGGRLF